MSDAGISGFIHRNICQHLDPILQRLRQRASSREQSGQGRALIFVDDEIVLHVRLLNEVTFNHVAGRVSMVLNHQPFVFRRPRPSALLPHACEKEAGPSEESHRVAESQTQEPFSAIRVFDTKFQLSQQASQLWVYNSTPRAELSIGT